MKKVLAMLAAAVACALLLHTVGSARLQTFFMQTARLSAISMLPRNYRHLWQSSGTVNTDTSVTPSATTPPVEAAPSQPENSSTAPAISADPAQAIGKVLRKTISPYGANTAYNKVYINNKTGLQLDIGAALARPLLFTVTGGAAPEILLYHTHATECYLPEARDFYVAEDAARTKEEQKNVIAVGEQVKAQLEAAGFSVLHDKTLHDSPAYTGSYSRSEATIKKYLEQYPSIKIIIDLHRDSISSGENDKVAPVTQIDGKNAAQVMLCIGSQTGGVTNFPNWEQNLALAVRLQQALEVQYPALARSALFLSQRYNQNLCPGALLIEMGSDANSLEEALYSGQLVGKALAGLLTTLKE